MNGVTTITTKGQVTIPEAIRRVLQAKIGDKVAFSQVTPSNREAVIKIIPANVVENLSGSLFTKVSEADYKKARKRAGDLLVKKYNVK